MNQLLFVCPGSETAIYKYDKLQVKYGNSWYLTFDILTKEQAKRAALMVSNNYLSNLNGIQVPVYRIARRTDELNPETYTVYPPPSKKGA